MLPLDTVTERPVDFIYSGDVIRLIHSGTGRNLHTHPISAPVTKSLYEVSAYGNLTIGDDKDYWTVHVVEDVYGLDADGRIKALTTRFKLYNEAVKCWLRTHAIVLPEWGFKQQEVVCDPRPEASTNPNSLWNVDYHRHPQ